MAHYMAIYRARSPMDGEAAEVMYRRIAKDFLAWSPPAGLTLESLWVSADNRTAFNLIETDDPALIAEVVAYFTPVGTYEVIPVVTPDETIASWVKAGLIEQPVTA
jgi:hypothetical protein